MRKQCEEGSTLAPLSLIDYNEEEIFWSGGLLYMHSFRTRSAASQRTSKELSPRTHSSSRQQRLSQGPLTQETILQMQQAYGNRAVTQFLHSLYSAGQTGLTGETEGSQQSPDPTMKANHAVVQRQKKEAEQFAKDNNISITITKKGIITYARDLNNPEDLRNGLIDAWNTNQTPRHKIKEAELEGQVEMEQEEEPQQKGKEKAETSTSHRKAARKRKREEMESDDQLVVGFWNTQGKHSFHSGNLQSYLAKRPDLDVLILGEYYHDKKIELKGWTEYSIEITPNRSLTKRGKSKQEYIWILARDGVEISKLNRTKIIDNFNRFAAHFTASKSKKEVSVTTFHAPYDSNSGIASQYMQELLSWDGSDILIGDANTYSGARKSIRASKRRKLLEKYELMSGDLKTSKGGYPLDKVYRRKDFAGEVEEVNLLQNLLQENTEGKQKRARRAKVKQINKKMNEQSDHHGIYARIDLSKLKKSGEEEEEVLEMEREEEEEEETGGTG
ncbi:hypothetical protein LOK74_22820 [Brevibacillus humidisoli]|uniref:hypothetical protein n=1 Tax=Brevibacillus humidisoli TaxID=2895522 RepID=UPI001E408C04|nr:hypothetical protein [Brevibacillus humidisoli]UFJ40790.1 hypothetical protein LOK74_22820 [Brevibacillus humidisoli]